MKVTPLFYAEPYCRNYVIGEEGGECAIIDFGAPNGEMLLHYVARHHSKCKALILTHGHFDHICGLIGVEEKIDFPVYIASEDECCLSDPHLNGSTSFGLPEVKINDSKLDIKNFDDGEEIDIGFIKLKAIKTPFHTLGSSIFLLGEESLFTGDSVFRYGIGRTDLPHAAPRMLSKSMAKIKAIQGNPKIYPGHGPSSFLSDEKQGNPYFSY